MDTRGVVDFSVYLPFLLSLGHSGNFQAPYMQNWKPEVSIIFSLNFFQLTHWVHYLEKYQDPNWNKWYKNINFISYSEVILF